MSVHCRWTKESPEGICSQVLRIRSVLRESNFPCLKLIEIVILWVYYTIPFDFSLFRHFWDIIFNVLSYFVWLRITDESSVPENRIWFQIVNQIPTWNGVYIWVEVSFHISLFNDWIKILQSALFICRFVLRRDTLPEMVLDTTQDVWQRT